MSGNAQPVTMNKVCAAITITTTVNAFTFAIFMSYKITFAESRPLRQMTQNGGLQYS
jgi:hypothetical protein